MLSAVELLGVLHDNITVVSGSAATCMLRTYRGDGDSERPALCMVAVRLGLVSAVLTCPCQALESCSIVVILNWPTDRLVHIEACMYCYRLMSSDQVMESKEIRRASDLWAGTISHVINDRF